MDERSVQGKNGNRLSMEDRIHQLCKQLAEEGNAFAAVELSRELRTELSRYSQCLQTKATWYQMAIEGTVDSSSPSQQG
jgi:hypothetical protein